VGDTASAPPKTLVNWMLEQMEAEIQAGSRSDNERVREMETPVRIPEGTRAFRCARSGLGVRIRHFDTANPDADRFAIGLFSLVDMPVDDPNTFICFFTGIPGFESRLYNAFDHMLVLKRAVADYAIALDKNLTSAGPNAAAYFQVLNTEAAPTASGERLLLMPRLLLDVKDVDQQGNYQKGSKEAYIRYLDEEPCSLAFAVNGAGSPDDPNINCQVDEALVRTTNLHGDLCWAFVLVLRRLPGVHIGANQELNFSYQRVWKDPQKRTRSGQRKTKTMSPIKQPGQWSMFEEGNDSWEERVELGKEIMQQWLYFHPDVTTTLAEMILLPQELCATPPIHRVEALGHGTSATRLYIKLKMVGEKLAKHVTFALPPATLQYDAYPNAVYWLTMAAICRFSHPDVTNLYRRVVGEAQLVFKLLTPFTMLSEADTINILRTAFLNIHDIFKTEHTKTFFRKAKKQIIKVRDYTNLSHGQYQLIEDMYAAMRTTGDAGAAAVPGHSSVASVESDNEHGDIYNEDDSSDTDGVSDTALDFPLESLQRVLDTALTDPVFDGLLGEEPCGSGESRECFAYEM